MTRGLALALGLAAVSSCRSTYPLPERSYEPVAREVLERFRLGEEENGGSLEPIHVLGSSEEADREGVDPPSALLELDDLMDSVERHFPLILAAREEIEIAEGRLQSSLGAFDTTLSARGLSEFEGFYEKDLLDLNFEQPTSLWGATFRGGYRLGRGDFAVYEGGNKTNDDGEFRLGLDLPLLRNREVDKRRIGFWKARLERAAADPIVLKKRLEVARKATVTYWKWVAAGRRREIAVRLLALAEDRMEQVGLAVDQGLLAPINRTENQRLIVDRRAKLVAEERKLQEAAIALSLYWRDEDGQPSVPPDEALPYDFPLPIAATDVLVPADEDFALEQRPEVLAGELKLEQLRLERGLAENSLLPQLDVGLYASQDIGDAVNVPDDKEDLELTALLSFEVPLQRREAKGRVRETGALLARLEREFQFVREAVVAEVQDARSDLTQSWLRIGQARENVRLANELAEAERLQLREGESDLLRVNLREQQAAVAAGGLVDALEDYFDALAVYRAVLGIANLRN